MTHGGTLLEVPLIHMKKLEKRRIPFISSFWAGLAIAFSAELVLALLIAVQVHAASEQAALDDLGIPHCIAGQAPTHSGDSKGLLLFWSRDPYQQTIRAVPLDRNNTVAIMTNQGGAGPGRQAEQPLRDYDCSDWKTLSDHARGGHLGTVLNGADTEIDGYAIDDQTRLALQQVRAGASQFHSESTPDAFLAAHPIGDYTVAIDRDLTNRFGVGFTTAIYKAWVGANPTDAAFRSEIVSGMSAFAASSHQAMLAQRFPNRVLVYVKGLGHELVSAKRFNALEDQLKVLGIPMVSVDTPSFDPVRGNAEKIRTQIDAVLSQGKNVILIALSKGATESIYALSELKPKLEGAARPQGYGKLEAFISLSGVFAPSYLINWADSFPKWFILENQLHKQFVASGLPVPDVTGIKDLDVPHMTQIEAEISHAGIPQQTLYINLIGAIPGDGIAADPSIQAIQNSLVRPMMGGYGANDGYVEYPGDQLPKAWVSGAHSLVIDSSHSIIDGSLQGMPLSTPDGARALVGALLTNVLDQIDGKLGEGAR